MKKTFEKLLKTIKNSSTIEELEDIYMECQKFKVLNDNGKEYKKIWETYLFQETLIKKHIISNE